jgi:hypothetical protein
MDTDYLTPMAYEIIIRANGILDVLKTEIGASCARYDTGDSFLTGTLQFVDKKIREPESYLDFWDYFNEIDVDQNSIRIWRG